MDKDTPTLTTGVYALPPTCTAFVRGGKVYVSLKKQVEDSFNQSYEAYVCKAKPKTNGMKNGYRAEINEQQRYYAASGHNKACSMYEPK